AAVAAEVEGAAGGAVAHVLDAEAPVGLDALEPGGGRGEEAERLAQHRGHVDAVEQEGLVALAGARGGGGEQEGGEDQSPHSLSPTIPATMRPRLARRAGAALSPRKRMPIAAVPAGRRRMP